MLEGYRGLFKIGKLKKILNSDFKGLNTHLATQNFYDVYSSRLFLNLKIRYIGSFRRKTQKHTETRNDTKSPTMYSSQFSKIFILSLDTTIGNINVLCRKESVNVYEQFARCTFENVF